MHFGRPLKPSIHAGKNKCDYLRILLAKFVGCLVECKWELFTHLYTSPAPSQAPTELGDSESQVAIRIWK